MIGILDHIFRRNGISKSLLAYYVYPPRGRESIHLCGLNYLLAFKTKSDLTTEVAERCARGEQQNHLFTINVSVALPIKGFKTI